MREEKKKNHLTELPSILDMDHMDLVNPLLQVPNSSLTDLTSTPVRVSLYTIPPNKQHVIPRVLDNPSSRMPPIPLPPQPLLELLKVDQEFIRRRALRERDGAPLGDGRLANLRVIGVEFGVHDFCALHAGKLELFGEGFVLFRLHEVGVVRELTPVEVQRLLALRMMMISGVGVTYHPVELSLVLVLKAPVAGAWWVLWRVLGEESVLPFV